MTPDQRRQLERDAERALRRGEVAEALAALRALVAAFPREESYNSRLTALEETLQPEELAAVPHPAPTPQAPPGSPIAQAEFLAAKGDFGGALTILRNLLAQNPDAELVKERLGELFALAQARGSRSPPRDPTLVLSELLDRIESRKRRDS